MKRRRRITPKPEGVPAGFEARELGKASLVLRDFGHPFEDSDGNVAGEIGPYVFMLPGFDALRFHARAIARRWEAH